MSFGISEFPIKMYLTWFKGFNELIHCSCATSTWYQFFIFLLSFVATLMAEHIFLVRSRGWLLKDNSLGTNIEKRLFMWLLWILFLDLFGHRAIVSAEPCILETNDSCDWKDVKDVNDITSEAIVAFYTSGMNKLELKPHPKDSKGIMFYIRHAKKYPEEPSALAALWKKKGY